MKKKIIKVTAAQLEKLAGMLLKVSDSPPGSCPSREQLMLQARGDTPLDEAHLISCAECAQNVEQMMEELELENKIIAFPFAGANAAWQDYCEEILDLVAGTHRQWDWKGQDVEAHMVEEENGNLVFKFTSTNFGLDGKPIRLRIGTRVFEDILEPASQTEVGAEIVISKPARPAKFSEIELLIDRG